MNISPALLIVVMEMAGASGLPDAAADQSPVIVSAVSPAGSVPRIVRKEPHETATSTGQRFPSGQTILDRATSSEEAATRLDRYSSTLRIPPPSSEPDTAATNSELSDGSGISEVVSQGIRVRNCLVEFDKLRNATLGARVQGTLVELRLHTVDAAGNPLVVPIREGVPVRAEQVLGYQDDDTQQAALKISQAKLRVAHAAAEKKDEVIYALDTIELDKTRVAKYEWVNQQGFNTVPELDVLEAKLKVKQSETSWRLAKYALEIERHEELQLQKSEVEAANVEVQRRRLISPFDGIVLKVHRTEGEWLREGDPVLQIVQLDTLTVTAKVGNATSYAPEKLEGCPVTVYAPSTSGGTIEFPGRIRFANPQILHGNKFEILIEVRNRRVDGAWLLRAGTMVDAIIHLTPDQQ